MDELIAPEFDNPIQETSRKNLKDNQFGIPEERKFPLDTKDHVKSAIKLFGHADEDKKKELAEKIADAAKKYNIEISKDIKVSEYLDESYITESPNTNNNPYRYDGDKTEESIRYAEYMNKHAGLAIVIPHFKSEVMKNQLIKYMDSDAQIRKESDILARKLFGDSNVEIYNKEIEYRNSDEYKKFIDYIYNGTVNESDDFIMELIGKDIEFKEFEYICDKAINFSQTSHLPIIDPRKKIQDVKQKYNEFLMIPDESKNMVNDECIKLFGIDMHTLYKNCINRYNNTHAVSEIKENYFGYGLLPMLSPKEMIDLGVYSEDNNLYSSNPDNTKIGNITTLQWFKEYTLLYKGIKTETFTESQKVWLDTLRKLYFDYHKLTEESEINARKQSILELGWNPNIDITSINTMNASNKCIKKIEESCNINIIKNENDILNETSTNSKLDNNHSNLNRLNLSSFKKIKIQESISKKYPILKHIRINKNTDGYIYLDKNDEVVAILNTEKKDDGIWIQALEITKKYQNHGLSKQLLNIAIKDFNVTKLSVNKNNQVAYNIYKSIGFKKDNETEKMLMMTLESVEDYIEENSNSEYTYSSLNKEEDIDDFYKSMKIVFNSKNDIRNNNIHKSMKSIKYNDEIIGYIGFSYYNEDNKKYLGIGNFMIKPKYQSSGHGSKIIKDIINKNKSKYDEIYCYVDEKNTKAINFYKRIANVDTKNITKYGYYVSLYTKNKSIREELKISFDITNINESVIFSKDDLYWNFENFESGKSNILLITGLSGSGKSTIAKQLSQKYKAEYVELDALWDLHDKFNYHKNKNTIFYEYLKDKNLVDKVKESEINDEFYNKILVNFIEYCISKSKDRRIVIEGIQIYEVYKEKARNYPLIIKGTSALKSFLQKSINREHWTYKEFLKYSKQDLSWLIRSDNDLNKLIKQITKPVSESIRETSYDYDTNIEESKTNNKSYPVSLIFVSGNSLLGKTIKKVLSIDYSHAAISLDSDLSRIYSFNNRNGFDGLAYESLKQYLKDGVDKIAVYTFFVSKDRYSALEKNLDYYSLFRNKTSYSVENLLSMPLNIPVQFNMKMVCSQFVDRLLKISDIDITNKKSSLVTPKDMYTSAVNNSNIFEIYTGSVKDMNIRAIERKIKSIQNKSTTVIFEDANNAKSIIVEAKPFPIQFDKEGNLLIKNIKRIDYDAEYANSHRLLKKYEQSNSIEGMKYELCKINFLVKLLEKDIYKNKKNKTVEKKIISRAKLLNDFNKYLAIVCNKDKDFNFTEYFEASPYNDALIKIDSNTLHHGLKILKDIL